MRVVALDRAHGVVQLRADVRALRQAEEEIEARVRREVDDAFGGVGFGVIDARAAAGAGGLFLQLLAALGEADFGEAEEDEAKNRAGVLLRSEAGIGAELIGGLPETFLQLVIRGIFF